MALLALRSQHSLAGIVALSAYLPLRKFPPLVAPANSKTPVFVCHGDADPTVSCLHIHHPSSAAGVSYRTSEPAMQA